MTRRENAGCVTRENLQSSLDILTSVHEIRSVQSHFESTKENVVDAFDSDHAPVSRVSTCHATEKRVTYE